MHSGMIGSMSARRSTFLVVRKFGVDRSTIEMKLLPCLDRAYTHELLVEVTYFAREKHIMALAGGRLGSSCRLQLFARFPCHFVL